MATGKNNYREALALANKALSLANAAHEAHTTLMENYKALLATHAEGKDLIEQLLAEVERLDNQVLILTLRPLAQKHVAQKNAAKAKGSATYQKSLVKVWRALIDERAKGTPSRSINKRVAADLGLTSQRIGQIRKDIDRLGMEK